MTAVMNDNATLPSEIFLEIEKLYDMYICNMNEENKQPFRDLVVFLQAHSEYINHFFMYMTCIEVVKKELFLEMLRLGLDLQKEFHNLLNEEFTGTLAVLCAGYHQFDMIEWMLENGLKVPTQETINWKNNIVNAFFMNDFRHHSNLNVLQCIQDVLKDHPLILSETTHEILSERYILSDDSMKEFLSKVTVH